MIQESHALRSIRQASSTTHMTCLFFMANWDSDKNIIVKKDFELKLVDIGQQTRYKIMVD